MTTIEKEEESVDIPMKKVEDTSAKEKAMERSAILAKARRVKLEKQEAKKRKIEESDNFLDIYNQQVENIHGHIKLINTNINTIVDILNHKKETKKVVVEEDTKVVDEEPKAMEISEPFINSKYSYILGQAVAVALAGGSLYYFKSSRDKINPAHLRYSVL